MSGRFAAVAVLLTGCAGFSPGPEHPAGSAKPASGRFVFHGDAALVAESLDVLDDTGTRLAADVGFEAAGCCGLGLYAAQTSRTTGQAKHDNA